MDEKNATEIENLQVRVSQLESELVFIMGVVPAMQHTIIDMQQRELRRQADRVTKQDGGVVVTEREVCG